MKQWMFIITIGLLGLTACTTLQGVTAISPKAGSPVHPTEVENLQPTLEWKSSSQGGETYDVIIFEAIFVKLLFPTSFCQDFQKTGKMVYYRERIKETYHKVEDPLEPNTDYFWSVRVRKGNKVSEWSRYNYSGGKYSNWKNCWFYFRTAKSK